MAKKVALPSNVEAERCVLGSMLMVPDASAIALASLTVDSFSDVDPRNKLIFNAMVELGNRKATIDPETVNDQLINMNLKEAAGSPSYLLELVDSAINPSSVDHYIGLVRDQAVLRDFLLEMEKVKGAYTNGEMTDIGEFIASSTQALDSIAGKRTVGDFKTAEEVAKTVARQIDLEKNRANKRLTGVDTGYTTLNKYTHGWQKGDLIILAARPSVGKTAFAINLAYNAAVHENKTVAFFSCEMSSDQIMKRLCSSVALVNSEAVQTGDLYGNDVIKVNNALEQIQHTKLFFDDTSNPILGDLLAKARKLQAAHPDLCLIMIDYLNLIGTGTHLESRSQEVSVITRSLKELARSLKVPVIALAQLNRDVEKSDNKIPMLSNLKESGSIEQDADQVMLMYRSDYYKSLGQETKPSKNQFTANLQNQVQQSQNRGNDNGSVSVVSINLAKNRNGRVGDITLLFSKNYSRFDNPSLEMEQAAAKMSGVPFDPTDDNG